ncbi:MULTISPECIES: glucose transporter [unclassified Bradyrhizobium]|nr:MULTISPECIES: glucose transporter [unclassified Bradyrhizobium]
MGTDLHIFCGRIQLTLAFGLLLAFVANVALLCVWL